MSIPLPVSAANATHSTSHLFHRLNDLEHCLYLQLYYWGRDIIHPMGNQLVEYGFHRIAKTTPEGTSRYQLPFADGLIELHGWCMGWYRPGQPGFVFVRKRRRIFLWHSPQPPCPQQLHHVPLQSPCHTAEWLQLAHTMQAFTQWMLTYEQWIATHHGKAYRTQIFHEYQTLPRAMRWLPPQAQHSWLSQFSQDLFQTPRARHRHRRITEHRQPLALA